MGLRCCFSTSPDPGLSANLPTPRRAVTTTGTALGPVKQAESQLSSQLITSTTCSTAAASNAFRSQNTSLRRCQQQPNPSLMSALLPSFRGALKSYSYTFLTSSLLTRAGGVPHAAPVQHVALASSGLSEGDLLLSNCHSHKIKPPISLKSEL